MAMCIFKVIQVQTFTYANMGNYLFFWYFSNVSLFYF